MTTVSRPILDRGRAYEDKQESQVLVVLRRFRRHKLAVISTILILFIFGVSLLAPILAPFERDAIDLSSSIRPAPPGTRDAAGQLHLLGIDHERLTYKFQGRRYRLTDVHGKIVDGLLA